MRTRAQIGERSPAENVSDFSRDVVSYEQSAFDSCSNNKITLLQEIYSNATSVAYIERNAELFPLSVKLNRVKNAVYAKLLRVNFDFSEVNANMTVSNPSTNMCILF